MRPEAIRLRLEQQGWMCAYAHVPAHEGVIEWGEPVAVAYDGHGIVHLECACEGFAPTGPDTALTKHDLLYERALEAGINLKDYDLPREAQRLKDDLAR